MQQATHFQELDELRNLLLAKKLLNNRYIQLCYGIICSTFLLGPIYYLQHKFDIENASTIFAIASLLALIIWATYLLTYYRSKVKRKILKSGVKVHKNNELTVGDYCCSLGNTLPIYKVSNVSSDKELLELKVILSKGRIGIRASN